MLRHQVSVWSILGVFLMMGPFAAGSSAATTNTVGGADFLGTINGPWDDYIYNAKGNAFRVDTSVRLLQEEFYLGFSGQQTVSFYVFESPVEFGTYSRVFSNSVSMVGQGDRWCSSGAIDVPMHAGRYYITAFSMPGDAFWCYYNIADSQSVSFGADVHAFATGFHPLGTTLSSTTNDRAVYYERLTTTAIPEPSTTGLLAAGAAVLVLTAWRRRFVSSLF